MESCFAVRENRSASRLLRTASSSSSTARCFPGRRCADNVAYGPMVQGRMNRRQAREGAADMLAEAGLPRFIGNKFPAEVSSGMARRAEIVRALINDPKVLLLDEPSRAMDAFTKSIMHEALLEVYDRTKVTIFFITHDLRRRSSSATRFIVTTVPPGLDKREVSDPAASRPHADSDQFRRLVAAIRDAVHEEAVKAFLAGERELA